MERITGSKQRYPLQARTSSMQKPKKINLDVPLPLKDFGRLGNYIKTRSARISKVFVANYFWARILAKIACLAVTDLPQKGKIQKKGWMKEKQRLHKVKAFKQTKLCALGCWKAKETCCLIAWITNQNAPSSLKTTTVYAPMMALIQHVTICTPRSIDALESSCGN